MPVANAIHPDLLASATAFGALLLCHRSDWGPCRDHRPAIMYQVFQPVRDDVEGRRIDGVFVARLGPAAFGFQNVVDLFLDIGKLALGIDAAYPPREAIKRV